MYIKFMSISRNKYDILIGNEFNLKNDIFFVQINLYLLRRFLPIFGRILREFPKKFKPVLKFCNTS